ncbi:MAG: flagellar protein FlgN [Magnetococcales bacterium]|nr:flagellar protein FlgN [Magnetococcales bacterium]
MEARKMRKAAFDAEDLIRQLKGILSQMIQRFEGLIALSEREREAIRQREPEKVEAASAEIAGVLKEIGRINSERQRLTLGLADGLGLPKKELDLLKVDAATGGRYGLKELRTKLQDAISRADQANKENKAILNGVLMATESVIKALKDGTRDSSIAYDRLGQRQASSGYNLFSKQL